MACGSCGAELGAKAKFCSQCGAPITTATTPAEYKQVTVFFADVVHSMDIAAAVVQRYGGTVDKFTGDGIMAVFGAPVALEDHAVRACLTALGIHEEAKRLTVDVRRCGAAVACRPELR